MARFMMRLLQGWGCQSSVGHTDDGAMTRALMSDPEHWRMRADAARAAAESLQDPEARRTMVEIALGYDKLAKLAEERILGGPRAKRP